MHLKDMHPSEESYVESISLDVYALTPAHLAGRGFEITRYKGSEGNWPTGFSGHGYALALDGQIVFRHAFRKDVIDEAERLASQAVEMTKEEMAEYASSGYGREFDARDIQLGKWNFRGGREVFAGSQYLGYYLNGSFVLDSKNWSVSPA